MSNSLTAHLLSLLYFASCALRVTDDNWQSITFAVDWHSLRRLQTCSKQQTHSITNCQPQ